MKKHKASKPIFVDRLVLQSEAYWDLSKHGIRVLFRFYEKRKVSPHKDSKGNTYYQIINNGDLVFTYDEAERWGIDRKQFSKAIDDLVAKGFLEITHQGAGQGDSSTYKLTQRWQAYGTKNFDPAPPRRKNTNPNWGWNIHNLKKQKSSGEKDTTISAKKHTKTSASVENVVSKRTPRNHNDPTATS